jgi:lysophospholipase L1-like esterase
MTTRVACIGDSLTWGFSLPDPWRQSYPALLQERLGADYAVRNFGCNGASVRCDADLPYVETLACGESRAWNSNIVLLMLGSNDATPWDWDAAAFRRDYERIVASYRELPSQPRVILIAPIRMFRVMGMTFGGLSPEILEDDIRPVIREVAGKCGLQCNDLVDLFADARYCYDGVHPNGEGVRLMAEVIYREFLKA